MFQTLSDIVKCLSAAAGGGVPTAAGGAAGAAATTGGRQRMGLLSMLKSSQIGRQMNNELKFPPNFEGLVLGCIDADFCK